MLEPFGSHTITTFLTLVPIVEQTTSHMIRKLTLLGAFVGLFAAGASAQVCAPATGLNVDIDTTALSMTVTVSGPDTLWERVEYQVRALGATSWKRARSTETTLMVNIAGNLAASTTYELRVRTACTIAPLSISPFFGPDTFTTPDAPVARVANPVSDLRFFPNPAINDLSVSYASETADQVIVELMDLSGRTIIRNTESVVAGANTLTVNVRNLENGNYLVRLTQGDATHVENIQVAR